MRSAVVSSSPQPHRLLSRREMLWTSGLGLGGLALNWLANAGAARAAGTATGLQPRPPHFRPAARAVILLMQNGGPSQMDLFDPKPELTRRSGQTHGERVEMFQLG